MTKENIIRMAKEARFYIKDDEAYSPSNQEDHELTEYLERFAKLVAKHERESCAELCECSHDYSKGNFNYHATLIRARGQA
jgi:hypothetical protein